MHHSMIPGDVLFLLIWHLQVGQQKYQAKILELQSQDKIAPEVLEQLATPAMLQNYIKTNKQLLEDTAKV